MNEVGFRPEARIHFEDEIAIHENAADGKDLLSDMYFDFDNFREETGLTSAEWDENEVVLLREMRKARRDMLRRYLAAAERLDHYSFDDPRLRQQPLLNPLSQCHRPWAQL